MFMLMFKHVFFSKQEVRHQTVMTHDPLPPADSVRGYERPRYASKVIH